jgi:uncharacterized protein (TIGR02996 family)
MTAGFTFDRHPKGGAGSRLEVSRTADDFLAEIAAKPDDDGLKRVFADWLLERGDVRGELMALQLKGERTDEELAREALLLKRHVKRWLPDEVLINLVPSSIAFEKGVFGSARVAVRSPVAMATSLKHPAWATVRRLRSPPPELVDSCPVLEELTEIDDLTLSTLAARTAPFARLHTLGVLGSDPSVLATCFASAAFADVRELRLGFVTDPRMHMGPPVWDGRYLPGRLSWLFDSALGRRLGRLVLHTGWIDLEPWLRGLDEVEPPMPELQLTPMPFEATNWWIRFSNRRRHVTLFEGSELNASYSEGPVREILATAPKGWFESVTLPQGVAWASVRRLPCFERALVG